MANTEPLREKSGSQLTDGLGRDMNTGKMKSMIQMKTESPIDQLNNPNRTFGSSGPRSRKLRCTTAMLGGAVAGILLAVPAVARDDDDHRGKVDHVLLISVDGLHQSDLAWYVLTHPNSTLAELTEEGVDYSNASTPFPSDSYPGMIAQVTGGNPSSTGAYYDDTWNHAVFPPGTTNCVGPAPGAEVTYQESIDKNQNALDAGQGIVPAPGSDPWANILKMTGNPLVVIDPLKLPVDPSTLRADLPRPISAREHNFRGGPSAPFADRVVRQAPRPASPVWSVRGRCRRLLYSRDQQQREPERSDGREPAGLDHR
jgi:type I phosphodiesterase/nucleotide pyrophosphatase